MGNVYVIREDGCTEPMTRIHCKNEDCQLQQVLEKNPDLLPGDQIDPDDPRRWMLIKREMPVQDPSTGTDRWSIDFFLVDQDAIPTFVECKRFKDTRARREVIGQVLEYAANGHYYWTSETIRNYADGTVREKGATLEDAVRQLCPDDENAADVFFDFIQRNLREGRVRLVFFLEEAPFELRSVVDFLNSQMERSEVLLVEARQYQKDGIKVLVPTLFGYTEQARLVKKALIVARGSRRKWDKSSFFADAGAKLGEHGIGPLKLLFDYCETSACEITWGTGRTRGSFNIKFPWLCPRSLFTVDSDGNLTFNFAWLRDTERAEGLRDRLLDLSAQRLPWGLSSDDRGTYRSFPISEWRGKVDEIVAILEQLLTEFTPRNDSPVP